MSAVKTNPSIVKSVVASIVVPLIVVCEDAPIVAPSIVPPFISAVVIVPKSATVLPAFVQLPITSSIVIAPNEPVYVAEPLATEKSFIVPVVVIFVADNVAPLNVKSLSSDKTPFVPACTTLPLDNPSAVKV